MLYQFRKELIETLLKKHEVVLSMPFAGHEEDFQAMGCKCINTKIDRRGINPLKDLHLIKFYNKLLKEEKPDKVITYSIKCNLRRAAATGAFASGHSAEHNGHLY